MAKSPKDVETEAVLAGDLPIEDALEDGGKSDKTGVARARFAKALDEARAGAEALGKEARERGEAVSEKLTEAVAATRVDLVEEARALSEEAKARAATLASEGKARASDALTGLGKVVADNAGVIDEHLGEKYGDYARQAARHIHETAAKIESKDLTEIGEDAREFVRTSPGLALGLATVVGFMLARAFRGGKD